MQTVGLHFCFQFFCRQAQTYDCFSAGRQPQEVCTTKWAPESYPPFPSFRLVFFPLPLSIFSRPSDMLIVFNYNCCHTRVSSYVLCICPQPCSSAPPCCWIWVSGCVDWLAVCVCGCGIRCVQVQEWRMGQKAHLRTVRLAGGMGWPQPAAKQRCPELAPAHFYGAKSSFQPRELEGWHALSITSRVTCEC